MNQTSHDYTLFIIHDINIHTIVPTSVYPSDASPIVVQNKDHQTISMVALQKEARVKRTEEMRF